MLVLMGAGASFGSDPMGGVTPPLGKDLFARLVELGGVASRLPPALKAVFEEDFEIGMGQLYEDHSELLQSFHRELAGYLVSFRPYDDSYYCQMLDLLAGKSVVFASLNYDLMFENCAGARGLRIFYNDNVYAPHVRLIKPHGSVNFWPSTKPEQFVGCQIAGRGSVRIPITVLGYEETIRRCAVDTSLSPAISLYAKGKRVVVAPDYVLKQQEAFAESCKAVRDIVILGVRVVPEDTHIWGSISQSPARITYFGSDVDSAEVLAWTAETGKKVEFVEGYFPALLKWLEGRG